MGGREEVQAQHVLGAAGDGRDLVHVEVGGVGREDRAGARHLVDVAEHGLLDVHLLEHGLHDQVGVGKRAHVRGGREIGRGAGLRGHLAARHGAVEVPRHGARAALQRLGRGLHHRDGDPGQQAGGGDAGAHGPAADHAHAVQPAGLDALELGQLGHGALGEEGVDHALALGRIHELREELPLAAQALRVGHLRGRLDGAHGLRGRDLAATLGERLLVRGVPVEGLRARHLRRAPWLAAPAQEFPGEGYAQGLRLALLHAVQDAQVERLRGGDVAARGDEVERRLGAGEAGQALRAAGAGHDAQGDLGQPHLGRWHGDPVVGGHGHLEPAAERGAVDRGHHGNARPLDPVAQVGQQGLLRGAPELGDVGARDEGPPLAEDDDGARLALGAVHRRPKPGAHRLAERVHRRVAHGEHGHLAPELVAHRLLHRLVHQSLPNAFPRTGSA